MEIGECLEKWTLATLVNNNEMNMSRCLMDVISQTCKQNVALQLPLKKKAKHEHTFYIVESYIDNDNFPFTFMEYT